MKHWLRAILKTVVPAARNAIACIAPAQFIHKPPSPLPDMRDGQVLHVKVALAIFAVLFDIQEVGTVGREHRRDVRSHIAKPSDVFLRPNGLEAAAWVVLALRGVWRRGDYEIGASTGEQTVHHVAVAAVSADHAVLAHVPDIACASYRLSRRLWDFLFVRLVVIGEFGVRQQLAQLVVAEAQAGEINLGIPQFCKLARERLVIPRGQIRELVVSQEIRSLLDFAEVIQDNHRDRFPAQLESRQVSAVSGDDVSLGIDQNWRIESEMRNAARYLCDLRVRVAPGVPGRRSEFNELPMLDPLRRRLRKHASPSVAIGLEVSFGRCVLDAAWGTGL